MAEDPALLGQGLPVKCSGFLAESYCEKTTSHIQTKNSLPKRSCIHLAVLCQHRYVTDESVTIVAVLAKVSSCSSKNL